MNIYLFTALLTCTTFLSSAQLPVGSDYVEIKLPDSLGKWKPLSELKSQLILLDFWAAWCYPCVRSMPDVKRIYDTYHSKGLAVYAVSLDKDYYAWVNACRRLELPFILVNDAYGMKGKSCMDYHITSIPNKMLLKDGKVIASEMSLYDLEKIIAKELSK